MVPLYDANRGRGSLPVSEERAGHEAGVSPQGPPPRGTSLYHRPGLPSPGDHSKTTEGQRHLPPVGHDPGKTSDPYEGYRFHNHRDRRTSLHQTDRGSRTFPSGHLSRPGAATQSPQDQTDDKDVVSIKSPGPPLSDSTLGRHW